MHRRSFAVKSDVSREMDELAEVLDLPVNTVKRVSYPQLHAIEQKHDDSNNLFDIQRHRSDTEAMESLAG